MKFHYSSYWRKWSRVLSQEGWLFNEVNLEPIPCSSDNWDRVKTVIIRQHRTARGRQDIEADSLPPQVIERMEKNLGKEKTEFLLNGDILPLIDWEKYKEHCNGGCPLNKCQKEEENK